MSVTEKQLAANRANAAKSTGPRTPEGKARSARNSRTHGFTASTFAVCRLEDLQEIAHLRTDLIAVYQPVNSQEQFALERMALTQQTILRAARLESGLFINCLDLALNDNGTFIAPMSRELAGDGDIEITRAQNRNYALADGVNRITRQFLRYQAQAERNYRRAVEEFERRKRLQPESPSEPIQEANPKKTNLVPSPANPFPSNRTRSRLRFSRGRAAPCCRRNRRPVVPPKVFPTHVSGTSFDLRREHVLLSTPC